MMTHFESTEWLDLARGAASPEAVAEMQKHLEAGCKECAEMAAEMNRMLQMSKREASYKPPQEAVHTAKALMSAQNLASPRAERHVLQALFDSATQPLAAGVRGAMAGRQLLYQKDNCCIDIRLEAKPGKRVEMVGQVLDSGAIGRGLDQIPVSLQKGEQIFARTLTNHFGEFRLVLDDTDNVQMIVDVTVDRRLIVPLPS
jgi:signal transduction histidine kinase